MLNLLVFLHKLDKKNLLQFHLIHQLQEFNLVILLDLIYLQMDFGIHIQLILK